MKKWVLMLGLLVAFSASAVEPPKDVVKLIKQEELLNNKCISGDGNDPATIKVCDQHDKVLGEIEAKGWSYRYDAETGTKRIWSPYHTEPSDKQASKQECGSGTPYCKDMSSCEEAQFYFKECGASDLDRDNDGIPCESLCK